MLVVCTVADIRLVFTIIFNVKLLINAYDCFFLLSNYCYFMYYTSFTNKQIQTLFLKVLNFKQLKLKVYSFKNKQEQKK